VHASGIVRASSGMLVSMILGRCEFQMGRQVGVDERRDAKVGPDDPTFQPVSANSISNTFGHPCP
jgi:hypothetical protein